MNISKDKNNLIKYGKNLVKKNLVVSSGGNISFKTNGIIYITSTGIALDEISTENLSKINLESGTLINNNKPSKESNMHLSIYRNKNVNVIIHAHPFYTTILASHKKIKSGSDIPYYSPGYAVKVGEIGLVDYYRPGSEELSKEVTKKIINKKAVLLKNHGVVVTANNFREALNLIEDIEVNARTYLQYNDVIESLNKNLFEE